MITVTFTPEEVHAAVQLFDIATKANGLQVAEAALVLRNKFFAAVQEAKKTEDEKEAA